MLRCWIYILEEIVLFLQDLVLFEVTVTCRIYKVAEFDTTNYNILVLFYSVGAYMQLHTLSILKASVGHVY